MLAYLGDIVVQNFGGALDQSIGPLKVVEIFNCADSGHSLEIGTEGEDLSNSNLLVRFFGIVGKFGFSRLAKLHL